MSDASNPSLSRRERERRMRRRAMLDAASAVFAEKGFEQAPLDEIAERAEFGKGTIYNYFEEGKEGLLFALFDEAYDDLQALIRSNFEEAGDRSFRASFHNFVVESFTYYEEREDLFLNLIKESQRLCFSDDPEKTEYFRRQQQRTIEALASAVEAAAEEGDISPLPTRSVTYMLLEVVYDLIVHRSLNEHRDTTDATCLADVSLLHDAEAAADFLTTLLFDGLETRRDDST